MPKKPPPWLSKQEVVEELKTLFLRLRPAFVAEKLWNRVFSQSDRRKLGGDLEKCYPKLGTLGMWMKARGVSNEWRAALDLAKALGILDSTTYAWLLREIGGRPNDEAAPNTPCWDAEAGDLLWRGEVILHVRPKKSPSYNQLIVGAFHEAQWPRCVTNPLPGDQQQLHQALRYLKELVKGKGISFHSREGATKIEWKED
jgi:hypothetical protein